MYLSRGIFVSLDKNIRVCYNKDMIVSKYEDLRRKKAYEEKRNLSDRTVAQEAGVSLGTIGRLKGKKPIQRVYLSSVDALCAYFDCELGELLEYKK